MDTGWSVQLSRGAKRELRSLPDSVRHEALAVIADLTEDPFPYGAVPLEGLTNWYRVRFYRNAYRIVYRVFERQQRVMIDRVRPRGTAYIGLE
jgi:mRNA-degrading endonuclease RelE of RelBE toxin-antitoxin system